MRAIAFSPEPARLAAGLAYARFTGRPATLRAGPLVWLEAPDPPLPGPGWVRVRTRLGCICATDLHLLRLAVSRRSSVLATRESSARRTVFLGHESVGVVEEAGTGVRTLVPGQRVVMVGGTHCAVLGIVPACESCAGGLPSLCEHRDEKPDFGPLGGGWSDRFLRHESQLFAVPEAIADETAVLFEPLACSVHAVLRRPPSPGSRVLVVGAGMIGLGIVSALRALGTPLTIAVLGRHRFQNDRALALGADQAVDAGAGDSYEGVARAAQTTVRGRHAGNRVLAGGFDQVFDCVGTAESLQDCLRWCRARGTVMLVGVDLFPGALDRSPIWHRELEVVGCLGYGMDEWEGRRAFTYQRVAEWLLAGRLRTGGLLTHRLPQDRFVEAIAQASDKAHHRAIRVALEFPGA